MPGKNKKKYTKKQMKIARVAEPRDRITAADFSMLRKYGKKKVKLIKLVIILNQECESDYSKASLHAMCKGLLQVNGLQEKHNYLRRCIKQEEEATDDEICKST